MRIALWRALGWHCLANAVLLFLISRYYAATLPPPADGEAAAYRLLAYWVHWPSLTLLSIGLPTALGILAWPRRRFARLLAAIPALAMVTVMLIDAVVYAQYRMHLGSYAWGLLFGGAGSEIFVFSTVMYVLAAAIWSASFVFEWALFGLCERWAARLRPRAVGRYLLGVWLLGFLALNFWHAWADVQQSQAVTREVRYLPFHRPLTAQSFLTRHGFVDESKLAARPRLEASGTDLYYPQHPLACSPPARPLNVLIVLIEAWRPDEMNPQVTPHIAAFAQQSTRFEQHYSGGNATRFGVFSLFYGIPGGYWKQVLATHTPAAMIRAFQDQDYRLAIYASASLASPEFNQTIFASVPELRLSTAGERTAERDARITQEFLADLGAHPRDTPFFGWLFYDSPHNYASLPGAPRPFQPELTQVNYLALGPDFDPVPYFNRHRNSIHFVDSEVGKVLAALRRQGRLENTVVIITADHSEEFNDSGKNYWGHNGNFSRYQLQVPLIVRWPGWPAVGYQHLTSHYDIAATLLSGVLGCRNPYRDYSIGVPLRQVAGRPNYLPVFDYTDVGVVLPERVYEISPFSGIQVYDHQYNLLEEAPRPEALSAVREGLVRFLRPPADPAAAP